MEDCIAIVGIRAHKREQDAPQVQAILTAHGSMIVARNGVPSPDKATGIITLTCSGAEDKVLALVTALREVAGVNAQYVMLECPL